jgi:hypothetical protein
MAFTMEASLALSPGVELLDQGRHGGLLVHGLVRQGAEVRAQGGDHPARQVEVLPVGVAEVLLDGDQLLLADEAVPAAQGLGVVGRVGVVGGHVLPHDGGGVAGDVEAGAEPVLHLHAHHGLGADAVPRALLAADELFDLLDIVLVRHGLEIPCWPGARQTGPSAAGRVTQA